METTNNKPMGNGHKPAQLTQVSMELLPLIMNNIPQAVFWKDRNLVYLGCNQAFADDAGFPSPEDVIGKTDFDMPWKDQAELYRADDSLVMKTGRSKINYEEPQTTPSGATIWLSTSKIPVRENGQVVAVLGMYEDVTARKQSEQALLLRDRALGSSLSAVIILNISDNRPIYVNDALLKMTGYTREEVMQIGLADITGNPEAAKEIRAAVQSKGFFIGEELIKRKDGSTFPASFFTSLIKDAKGQPLAVQSNFFDISERKQAEEAIHESEERFRRFTEATEEGLVFHENGKIIDTNSAALAMFGLSDTLELIGKNLLEYIVPESHKTVLQQMQLETVLPYEIQCVRKDGTVFPVETSTRAYKVGDKVIRASSIRDITERKKAEQAIRQSETNLSSALRVANMGYWEYDIATETFMLNDQYYSLHGMTAQDAGGYQVSLQKFAQEFVWPEDAPIVGQATQQAIETKDPNFQVQIEARVMHKDGNPRWMAVWFRIEKDEKGQTVKLHGVNQDITERKQLEAQVQEAFERRGYQVQLSTEVSQEIAAATHTNDLFDRVVKLTKERFGYYHTQLLRYDPAQDAVVLIHGYGETGQKMLAGGHKMPMGEGLIGTAAATGETVLRPTLADDPDWHPNPLLPDTRGEIAVPIKWQDQVLGVLDVQSNQAGALAEDDRLLLEGLCGQIAIAMHSAELVEILRQNEARLAEALKIARLGNWEYDFENDLFHFTDEFYAIFRTTAEKVGGYKISSADYAKHFVHPDDAPLVGIEIQKVLDAKDRLFTTHLEHRIVFSDGEVGYISVNINVERDENGKITRWYGANQDITERRKAEEALRVNEARLAEALTAARLANWEYDVEKDLFTFNDQFYSIFHTTVEKVGGYQLSSARYAELFVHPDDMEVVGAEIGKALNSTERVYSTAIDHRILYADGGVGYITVKLTVERDENGKITRYYGANQDITEQRKVQEEMAERLEEINRLYRSMNQEGWKTYRETTALPAGFVFDQASVKPVEEAALDDQSFTSIPMKVLGGEVVGTLAVANNPQQPMSEDDLAFLQQVSDQIALALEGARLAGQTQLALAQSEKMFVSSRALTQATNLQELTATTMNLLNIQEMNRAVLTTFNYDFENNIESLDIIANWWNGTGHEVTAIGTHYPISVIRAMSFFVSPTPVFFSDTLTDTRVDATTLQLVQRLNLRSVGVLPLYAGTQQIGALVLEGEEPHNFTEEETRLFTALAPQIATMLENRRQYERAQKQAEREAMLNVINQKIQSATSVEAVLQIAARELGHALGAPMTIAQLSMKDKSS